MTEFVSADAFALRPIFARRGISALQALVWSYAVLTAVRIAAEYAPPLWFPLLIAYAALPLLLFPRTDWPRLGFRKLCNLPPLFIGIILAALTKAATIAALFGVFGHRQANWQLGVARHLAGLPSQPPAILGIILFFMIGAPLAEEVFFRALQAGWARRYGRAAAVLASALLFGLAHVEYLFPFTPIGFAIRVVPVTLYGLVHAWVFDRTGSTYAAMATHLAGNAAEALVLGLFVIPGL